MTEQERIAAIRRGTRKTERRERRYVSLLRRTVIILDALADEIEKEIEK